MKADALPGVTSSRTKRIAHLIYSPAVGGSEMAAFAICSRLDRAAFSPLMLFMYDGPGPLPQVLASAGIPCHHLRRQGLRRLFAPIALALSLRRLRIDVLHVHHAPLFMRVRLAARLAGIAHIVFTEHAKFSISRSPRLQRVCRQAAVIADAFTVVSEDLKKYFCQQLGIEPGRIEVIHNGVDTERYVPGPRSAALAALLPEGWQGPVAVTVGRLTEAKDHGTLLAAQEILKGAGLAPYLLIIGGGELQGWLENEISVRDLSDCVRLAGPRTDVDALMSGATMFVLSSQREGFPMVILEAMACGLPVIATRVGGIPEALSDNFDALLVASQNPAALAEAMRKVLLGPRLGATLGQQARQSVESRFSLASIVERYSRLYRSFSLAGSP